MSMQTNSGGTFSPDLNNLPGATPPYVPTGASSSTPPIGTPGSIDTVSLLIDGRMHSQWEYYDIDSSLLIPADAWQASLGLPLGEMPPTVVAGVPVEVRVGMDTVMTGRIDDISHSISHNSHTLTISGRDGAAVLVDCAAPVITRKQVSLEEVAADITRPLGIEKIRIDAEGKVKDKKLHKVNVDPGDTAWDVLKKLAQINGLWPWFEPDGTLVIGGPDYSKPPIASLVLCRSGAGNNVISLSYSQSIVSRFSEYTVLGQAPAVVDELGRSDLKQTVRDELVKANRPHTVFNPDIVDKEGAQKLARKLIADSRLNGSTLTAVVKGHRNSGGVLWQPGQRIHVVSEPHGIDAVYFLMSRRFQGGRGRGSTATLTLKEDGLWNPDAQADANLKGISNVE